MSQVETHFSTIFVLSKTALKSNTGALALGQTNGGFCHCRNTSQIEMYFLCRSMAFGEEGGRMLTLSASPPIPRIRKAAVKRLFVRIPPLVTKQSAGRPLSRSGQSADWPARGRLLRNRPALTGAERRISLWAQGGTRFARAVCAPQTEGF